MKKKIGNTVYVQNYDMYYLLSTLKKVPAVIADCFSRNKELLATTNEGSDKDFVFGFQGDAASWIMRQEWLIDFDTYSGMTPRQVHKEWKYKRKLWLSTLKDWNKASVEERKKYGDEREDSISKLEHCVISLNLMESYLRGKEHFDVPN
jgi:hypothetical protein